MSGKISIKGLNKIALLKALWENMRPKAFFNSFDVKSAEKAVKSYIDYFNGRCIKCDLSGDEVDPWLYDRDAGAGAFQKIVDGIRLLEQE